MQAGWALSFFAAILLCLAGTPVARRVALRAGIVDHPAARKSHAAPVPYLGGLAIMVGALSGLVLGPSLPARVGVLVLAAAGLGIVGLFDDDRTLHPAPRLAAQVAAAMAVLAVGLRAHVTGDIAVDMVITVVWVVGITNAVNFLDNMDGLASGVAAAAAGATFVLAALAGQVVVATVSAALVGACLGFLVHNLRPASIFMGDAGSLFLGFLLAVVTLGVDPNLDPPASFVVPLLVLSLPVLDTTTVTLGRLRRRRSVLEGGRDHLSHRLVAQGLTPRKATVALVGAELVLGTMAVLVGRAVVGLTVTMVAASALVLAITALTVTAPVYDRPAFGLPGWFRLAAVAVVALLAAPAAMALGATDGEARAGSVEAMTTVTLGSYDSEDAKRTDVQVADVVRVRGEGCPAGTTVSLALDGRPVATSRAGSTGRFSADLPALAEDDVGRQRVTASCAPLVLAVELSVVDDAGPLAADGTFSPLPMAATGGGLGALGLSLLAIMRRRSGLTFGRLRRTVVAPALHAEPGPERST